MRPDPVGLISPIILYGATPVRVCVARVALAGGGRRQWGGRAVTRVYDIPALDTDLPPRGIRRRGKEARGRKGDRRRLVPVLSMKTELTTAVLAEKKTLG